MNKREHEASIHTDFSKGQTSYSTYLDLSRLLTSQHPRSSPEHHDELLFIIQHQTSELWMKLLIHELTAAIRSVRDGNLSPCFKILARVGQIQTQLFEQWSVLETLTPSEYLEFRSVLGPSSGFQSYQYRAIEFLLGNKDPQALLPHRHAEEIHGWLQGLLAAPSLYDEFLRYLSRAGYAIPAERVERDFTLPYEAHDGVMRVFKEIYENTSKHWAPYEMCEKLVDVEERFQLWRYRHLMTVQRVIGFRRGTGGSSGAGFLRKALDLTFFPELWNVRTELSQK